MMNIKNKIRYKIWKHLNKKLQKKGIISPPFEKQEESSVEKKSSFYQVPCPEITDILCTAIAHPSKEKIFIDENFDINLYNKLQQFGNIDLDTIYKKYLTRFQYNLDKYKRNKLPSTPTKRLFIATGTISLINMLCYIKETENEGCFNDRIVICGAYFPHFIEQTLNILNLFNFQKIYFCKSSDNVKEVCLYNELYDVDEVCSIPIYSPVIDALKTLYLSTKINLISENFLFIPLSTLFSETQINLFYERAFSDKLDYPYPSKIPQRYMKEKTFKSVIEEIRKKLDLKIELSEGKWVLFCADCTVNPERHQTAVQNLINKGFKVLFKPHPRISLPYYQLEETPDLKILNATYSLELYDLSKILAVVSWTSLSLHTLIDLGIPCFSIHKDDISEIDFQKRENFLAKSYVLPIQELMSINLSESTEKIKTLLLKKQQKFIKNKPLLSQNKEFLKTFPEKKKG